MSIRRGQTDCHVAKVQGAAAEHAAAQKTIKYADMHSYEFVPIVWKHWGHGVTTH